MKKRMRWLHFHFSANGLKYHREKSKCDDSDIVLDGTKMATAPAFHDTRGYIPVPLELSQDDGNDDEDGDNIKNRQDMDNLTKLAIIATSPQSPLMQRHKPPWDIRPRCAHFLFLFS